MKPFRLDPGAALLLGLLLFALRPEELAAVVTAALIHELGHVLALCVLGVPIFGVTITLGGPVLRCGGTDRRFSELLAAVSGPAAGLLLWSAARGVWPLCAEVSLLLSLVNLLPVRPLDGGRALAAMMCGRSAERLLAILEWAIPVGITLAGLLAVSRGYGAGPVFFGCWLLLLACQEPGIDVK